MCSESRRNYLMIDDYTKEGEGSSHCYSESPADCLMICDWTKKSETLTHC